MVLTVHPTSIATLWLYNPLAQPLQVPPTLTIVSEWHEQHITPQVVWRVIYSHVSPAHLFDIRSRDATIHLFLPLLLLNLAKMRSSLLCRSLLLFLQFQLSPAFKPVYCVARTAKAHIKGHLGIPDSVCEWLGIPYASPPTGQLRFALPTKFDLEGLIDADRYVRWLHLSTFSTHKVAGVWLSANSF